MQTEFLAQEEVCISCFLFMEEKGRRITPKSSSSDYTARRTLLNPNVLGMSALLTYVGGFL